MVFNATFNNISVIWWRSVLLVEETGIPCEKHRPSASHWKTLSHNVVWVHLTLSWTHNISGDRHWLHRYCKSSYHMITTIQLSHDHNHDGPSKLYLCNCKGIKRFYLKLIQ